MASSPADTAPTSSAIFARNESDWGGETDRNNTNEYRDPAQRGLLLHVYFW